jgi:hypothetical protein
MSVQNQVLSKHGAVRGHSPAILWFNPTGRMLKLTTACVLLLLPTHTRNRMVTQGHDHAEKGGVYLSEEHLVAFEKYKCLFKGPLTVPPGGKVGTDQSKNPHLTFRPVTLDISTIVLFPDPGTALG